MSQISCETQMLEIKFVADPQILKKVTFKSYYRENSNLNSGDHYLEIPLRNLLNLLLCSLNFYVLVYLFCQERRFLGPILVNRLSGPPVGLKLRGRYNYLTDQLYWMIP